MPTINYALSLVTEWHCYNFLFILYSVFDVVMVFNQLFLVYESMMIQCMYICTLIPCNGVDREINSYLLILSYQALSFVERSHIHVKHGPRIEN